jgi:hypothetical protein
MQTLLTVLGGILVAGVGAWINDRYRRARPSVIPTSMRLSNDVIPAGSVVEPNSDLLATCSEHPFLDTPDLLGEVKVPEHLYVDYLIRTLTNVQELVRVQLPAITRRAQQLQMSLAAEDFEGVARAWCQADQQLWVYAEGGYIRDEYDLNDAGADRYQTVAEAEEILGKASDHPEIGHNSNGTTWVRYPGFVRVLAFAPRDRAGRAGLASYALAERMAVAFACHKREDLVCVFNFLVGIEREAPKLEALAQKIEDELNRLTRLSVTALISNTGGTPVSISRQVCKATLFVDGYPYSVSDDKSSAPRERRGELELELVLLDEEGHRSPPLVVEPGATQTITAVYELPLTEEDLSDGGTLHELIRSLLNGSERRWQLEVDAVLQRDAAKPITSRKIKFRDIHSSDIEVGRDARASAQQHEDLMRRRVTLVENELSVARGEASSLRQRLDMSLAEYARLRDHFGQLSSYVTEHLQIQDPSVDGHSTVPPANPMGESAAP